MLTEIYIEALLVDEELADQVWETWDKGEIDASSAIMLWSMIAFGAGEQENESCIESVFI